MAGVRSVAGRVSPLISLEIVTMSLSGVTHLSVCLLQRLTCWSELTILGPTLEVTVEILMRAND